LEIWYACRSPKEWKSTNQGPIYGFSIVFLEISEHKFDSTLKAIDPFKDSETVENSPVIRKSSKTIFQGVNTKNTPQKAEDPKRSEENPFQINMGIVNLPKSTDNQRSRETLGKTNIHPTWKYIFHWLKDILDGERTQFRKNTVDISHTNQIIKNLLHRLVTMKQDNQRTVQTDVKIVQSEDFLEQGNTRLRKKKKSRRDSG